MNITRRRVVHTDTRAAVHIVCSALYHKKIEWNGRWNWRAGGLAMCLRRSTGTYWEAGCTGVCFTMAAVGSSRGRSLVLWPGVSYTSSSTRSSVVSSLFQDTFFMGFFYKFSEIPFSLGLYSLFTFFLCLNCYFHIFKFSDISDFKISANLLNFFFFRFFKELFSSCLKCWMNPFKILEIFSFASR